LRKKDRIMRAINRDGRAPYPPRISEATRPFWEALRDGRLTTTRCQDCGDTTFPPKAVCPNCFSERLSWQPLSGRGTLYSYSTVWAGPKVFEEELPYTVCVVDLDEGLRVGSRLILDNGIEPMVGQRVTPVWVHYTDVTLFCFEPEEA
jgi:uncharacterized protein